MSIKETNCYYRKANQKQHKLLINKLYKINIIFKSAKIILMLKMKTYKKNILSTSCQIFFNCRLI